MLAKCRLANTVFVSGHRCSAGCNSGEWGWQEEQMDMLGHAHLGAVMPAGTVEDQHDLLVWTRTDLLGERL
jgi:hypothetical protein